MSRTMPLSELLTPEMIERHRDHIVDFLSQEGITPHSDDLGSTQLPERALKELLSELADDLGR